MEILKYEDAIKNCRFCFMCRHLSGTGNVTYSEADTPRVRAAMLYSITQKPELLADPDFIDTVYRADLSGVCTRHCVSHYPETKLLLAARQDIVDAGLAPAKVQELADKFESAPEWVVTGEGDVLFFVDMYTYETPEIAESFDELAQAAGIRYRTIRGGCIGKQLRVLGYREKSKKMAAKFTKFINSLGAKTLVLSNPATMSTMFMEYREYGLELNVEVLHTSEFFARQNFTYRKEPRKISYLESDFLRNYLDGYPGPARLLEQIGVERLPFGTNDEESYTAGEGAMLFMQLHMELLQKIVARIAERAEPGVQLVTASPYTRLVLSRFGNLDVVTLEELAAQQLETR